MKTNQKDLEKSLFCYGKFNEHKYINLNYELLSIQNQILSEKIITEADESQMIDVLPSWHSTLSFGEALESISNEPTVIKEILKTLQLDVPLGFCESRLYILHNVFTEAHENITFIDLFSIFKKPLNKLVLDPLRVMQLIEYKCVHNGTIPSLYLTYRESDGAIFVISTTGTNNLGNQDFGIYCLSDTTLWKTDEIFSIVVPRLT